MKEGYNLIFERKPCYTTYKSLATTDVKLALPKYIIFSCRYDLCAENMLYRSSRNTDNNNTIFVIGTYKRQFDFTPDSSTK